VAVSFIGGNRRNPPTCRKSLTNFITCCIGIWAYVPLRHLLVTIHRLLFRKGGFVTGIGWRRCTCWWFCVCKPVINTCIYQNDYRYNSKQQINQSHTLSFFSVPLWSIFLLGTSLVYLSSRYLSFTNTKSSASTSPPANAGYKPPFSEEEAVDCHQ
jgi:hypothetical protein